ncbi:hypothetical protein LTR53_016198 [Teratosphaeriaceae sp. CCFEE 6253]|nr:hypothetical protein LTR53_016198 [Teratosphaeriaceae sp. CCFEE 6253]
MALLGELPKAMNLRQSQQTLSSDETAPGVPFTKHESGVIKLESVGKSRMSRTTRTASAWQWSDFATAYMKDYEARKAATYPTTDSVSPKEYSRWLESLRPIEYASAQRVSESGFFRGVHLDNAVSVIQDGLGSGGLRLRDGWLNLLGLFLQGGRDDAPDGSCLTIISVNWSTSFIRSSLYHAIDGLTHLREDLKMNLIGLVQGMVIRSNEIEGIVDPEGSSGRLIGEVRTAQDKAKQMDAARASLAGISTSRDDWAPLTVYVGDSATDHDCLRRADVGIWMCDCSPSEVKQRFVKAFRPLDVSSDIPRSVTEASGVDQRGWCVWARDLQEVADFLVRLEGMP